MKNYDQYKEFFSSMSLSLDFNWRYVYLIAIGLKFVLALSNSYIHPDEHFQSFEVLTNKIFSFTTTTPWEFSSDTPARSFGPLYLFYAPLLYSIKLVGYELSPLQIWYMARLQNVLIGWVITDMCIYRLLPTKPERIKGLFYTLTSYITLVYQSHCFSNSIETWLVLICVLVINDLRFIQELNVPELQSQRQYQKLFWFGALVSIGIFNRITFPAFLALPSLYLMKYFRHNKMSAIFSLLGFMLPTIAIILLDTFEFNGSIDDILKHPLDFNSYVITPLNNLIYNSKVENLSNHGLHPYYTHLLVNLPQILGPGLFFMVSNFKNQYWKTTPFLAVISGVSVLSLIPHQELRFLIPIVPLVCCCFDLKNISSASKGERITKAPPMVSVLMNLWYLFNILLAVLMGVYHQGGIVPALDYFHSNIFQENSRQSVQIWWRTYSPPPWILGDKLDTLQVLTVTDDSPQFELDSSKSNYLIDAMGSDYTHVSKLIESFKDFSVSIYLIAPIASIRKHYDISMHQVWNYTHHLDLDHIDFSDFQSLKPGLGIYELL